MSRVYDALCKNSICIFTKREQERQPCRFVQDQAAEWARQRVRRLTEPSALTVHSGVLLRG